MGNVPFPRTDPGLLAWSLNFTTKINLTPVLFGLTAPLAASYQTVHDLYATSLAACDPSVRTPGAVSAKNVARDDLKIQANLLANLVFGAASVTDAQKLDLRLTVRSAPTPVPPPANAPALDVIGVFGRTVRIRLHDSTEPSRRGRALGTDGASLFSFTGPVAPVDPALWKFEANTGKTVVDVEFPETLAPGAQVWICAFWFNNSKESGPACAPVGVQFGSAALAA